MSDDLNSIVSLLSKVQFKAELDWGSYILVLAMAGLGAFLVPYLKKKGERVATKEDFDGILAELKSNTEAIEQVKTKFSEQTWINQQVWVKKQEAYTSIFSLLLNVKKYVTHQVSQFEEWQDLNCYHSYFSYNYPKHLEEELKEEWEQAKKAYEEKIESPENRKEAQELKLNYEKSISKLFDLIDLHSIYLNNGVEDQIKELKNQLSTTDDHEDWDMHFERISEATSNAINKIREISREELKIGI